jgi:hypothetical protein
MLPIVRVRIHDFLELDLTQVDVQSLFMAAR